MIPVALFVRFGVGRRVAFPIVPRLCREPAWTTRDAPATTLTWGPFRLVCVWSGR